MEHQTVKKVKQTSGLFKFKSLNRVLGDTEKLEEEKKKLHNHWWKIACTEIASAYASREKRHLQISQLMTSLAQEIAEKFRLIIKIEEEESEDGIIEDQENTSDMGILMVLFRTMIKKTLSLVLVFKLSSGFLHSIVNINPILSLKV